MEAYKVVPVWIRRCEDLLCVPQSPANLEEVKLAWWKAHGSL